MSDKIKDEIENLSDEYQQVYKILKSGPYTYQEIADKVFGKNNIFAIKHVYSIVASLRKRLELPFYPYMGPNTPVVLPRTKKDGEIVLTYVKKRSLGVVKGFMRTVRYVDSHFEMGRATGNAVQEFEDILNQ